MRILLVFALAAALLLPSGLVAHAEDGLMFSDSGLPDPDPCDTLCRLGEAIVNTWEHVIDTLTNNFPPAEGTGTAIRN